MKAAAHSITCTHGINAACIYTLTGLSRAGKTAAGRKAATLCCMPFYDSDELLHAATQRTPREFYLEHGKHAFYHAEADALIHFFSNHQSVPCILALGGGFCDNPFVAYPKKEKLYPIFLDASEEVLFTRLTDEALRHGSYPAFLSALPAHAHTEARRLFSVLYKRRKQRYTVSASYIIDVTALTIKETAVQIAQRIAECG